MNISIKESGEANVFFISDEKNWTATVRFNGEMTNIRQEKIAQLLAKAIDDADYEFALLDACEAALEDLVDTVNYEENDEQTHATVNKLAAILERKKYR